MAKKKGTSGKQKAVRAKKKTTSGTGKAVRAKTSIKKLSMKKPTAVRKGRTSLRARGQTLGSASKPAGEAKISVRSRRKKPLTARERRKFRTMLVHLRDRIAGQINSLATDNLVRKQDDREVNFRSEDQGTDNYDRDLALNRVSLDQDTILEIDEALNRIQIGAYGLCVHCERPIEKARLAAVPYSRMCVSCQSAVESGRRGDRSSDDVLFPDADRSVVDTGTDDK
ncbi:TraR/DksA family transcriptional regulator [Verrucomicrobiota bacterium]